MKVPGMTFYAGSQSGLLLNRVTDKAFANEEKGSRSNSG